MQTQSLKIPPENTGKYSRTSILFSVLPPDSELKESLGSGSSNANLPSVHQKFNRDAMAAESRSIGTISQNYSIWVQFIQCETQV